MSFQGFPDEGLVFYEGLQADNTKTYWTRNKRSYDTHVRGPLLALLEELAPEFGPAKLFRPYRDVRFSNDKTPYKTHQGAVIQPEGRTAAWYLQISADGLRVGGGCWRLESDQVGRYRRAVADELQGPRLQAEVERLSAAGWAIDGERLVRVPAGFDRDVPRLELLKHKSLHSGRSWEPAEWLHTRRALEEVREAWRDLTGLNAWLDANVGATTTEPGRRR